MPTHTKKERAKRKGLGGIMARAFTATVPSRRAKDLKAGAKAAKKRRKK